ncbi:MAG: sulfotransferase [Candidatus Sungbacteria bacterium]|uniref:Sulfotransferase n=1 Tax=Candidatus Sungiibacteriota bacterium TaxID=2750080 RepID=A0A932R242_9BACT|nr:sulfotransferase [Candidatus Sungbacteria bacterium]
MLKALLRDVAVWKSGDPNKAWFTPVYPLPDPLPPLPGFDPIAAQVDAMHRHQNQSLRQRLPIGTKKRLARWLDKWSADFSSCLDRPQAMVRTDLFYLYEAYLNQDIEYSLRIINTFPFFPGNPYMVLDSFTGHMEFIARYLQGVSRRSPKILPVPFIAFSKTASAHIGVALSRLLGLPETVLAYQHQTGLRAWVNSFARFGGITHDHYQPTPENLSLLREAGIRRLIIHRRHPVQTIISHAFHFVRINLEPGRVLSREEQITRARDWLDRELDGMMRRYAQWWSGWRREAGEGRIEMLATRYEDMGANPLAFFRRVLAFYGADGIADARIEKVLKEASSQNFRRGDPDE